MTKRFEVIKTKFSSAEEVTAILTRHLEAEEIGWLKTNGISEFDCVELDLEAGQINMAVSFINCSN